MREKIFRLYPMRFAMPQAACEPNVNKDRRQRKEMGMTGKQYRKWKKSQRKNKKHEEMIVDDQIEDCEKPAVKGEKNGLCNRSACLSPECVVWFNHSTRKYYCAKCAKELNEDRFNKADAERLFGHDLCTEEE